MNNQNQEQKASVQMDTLLIASGWLMQDFAKLNLGAGVGVAIRLYQMVVGPEDYVLFVEVRAVGVVVAKHFDGGGKISYLKRKSRNIQGLILNK